MNRDEIIFETQHAALVRLVAAVFAVMGLLPDGPVLSSLSAPLRRRVLRILAPSESALRRLIFFRARGVTVPEKRKGSAPNRSAPPKRDGTTKRRPVFALFDPRKWFPELAKTRRPKRGPDPSISSFDEDRRVPEPPPSRPEKAEPDPAGEIFWRTQPLRPGWPPGHRKVWTHPVDSILWRGKNRAPRIRPDAKRRMIISDTVVSIVGGRVLVCQASSLLFNSSNSASFSAIFWRRWASYLSGFRDSKRSSRLKTSAILTSRVSNPRRR